MAGKRLWLEDRLPVPPAAPRHATRRAAAAANVLEYIVVDEIADGVAELIIEPWPETDERGRLIFAQSGKRTEAAVSVADLEVVARAEPPAGVPADSPLRARTLRTGDVIGAYVDRAALAVSPADLKAWLLPPLMDATSKARDAAKAQYFAAVGPVLTGSEVDQIAEEFYEDEEA